MHTMKLLRFCLMPLLAVVGIILAGCPRPPVRVDKKTEGPAREADPFRSALESFRYNESSVPGNEWTRFRSPGFDQLGNHFAKADVIKRVRDQAAENRKFLRSAAHLTDEELAEVESVTFRTADAHYLDECFLLRDAVQAQEINDLAPLDKARHLFGWVMRNVMPHEQGDSWTPPAFTLRRGFGSPLERALVFLAVLRQAKIEGCLIVVPETEPTQFLTAALAGEQLYLFDTHLGSPLLNADGGVLSLAAALEKPALLEPARITPEQAKKLEAWLACPLQAMAPRLLETQKGLAKQDPHIVLYLDAADLAAQVGKATRLPVKVWNPVAAAGKLPNSPTRCLRLFLPRQEGGLDESDPPRVAQAQVARLPWGPIRANYAQIRFTDSYPAKAAWVQLRGYSVDLLAKYDLQPREMYLHGLYDSMIRRQERLQVFTQDHSLMRLIQNAEFRKEVAGWQAAMEKANTAMLAGETAQMQEQGKQAMAFLWQRDRFMVWLLDTSVDDATKLEKREREKMDEKDEKTVFTRVLAVGLREYCELELLRSQAATNHEKAANSQAQLEAQKMAAADAKAAGRAEWTSARNGWRFYLDRIVLDALIKERLDQMRAAGIDQKLAVLEAAHLEAHKYFQAKLCFAECVERLDGAKASKDYLAQMKGEIEKLEKDGRLKAEVAALSIPPVMAHPILKRRLELLANDWSDPGSYVWMKRRIDLVVK
jgi:hypothetical protein